MTVIIRPRISKRKRIPRFASSTTKQLYGRESEEKEMTCNKNSQPACEMSYVLIEREFGRLILPKLDRLMQYFGFFIGDDGGYYANEFPSGSILEELMGKLEKENIMPQLANWTCKGREGAVDLLKEYGAYDYYVTTMGTNYPGEYPEDF